MVSYHSHVYVLLVVILIGAALPQTARAGKMVYRCNPSQEYIPGVLIADPCNTKPDNRTAVAAAKAAADAKAAAEAKAEAKAKADREAATEAKAKADREAAAQAKADRVREASKKKPCRQRNGRQRGRC